MTISANQARILESQQGGTIAAAAARAGCSLEDAALYLFGGGYTAWRRPQPRPAEEPPADTINHGETNDVPTTDGAQDADVQTAELGQPADAAAGNEEPGLGEESNEPGTAESGEAAGLSQQEPISQPDGAAPAPLGNEGATRYRLTDGAGRYLRKSGTGMTLNRTEAWVGTAPQMEAAIKANRSLKDLDPERVP